MGRARPIILLALMALIPAVVFAGLFERYLIDQQRQTFDQQLSDRAVNLATAVDRELSTQVQLLAVLSESPRLDPPQDQARFSEIAERLRLRIPVWDLIKVTDLGGNILATVPQRPAKQVNDATSLHALSLAQSPVIGNLSRGPAGNLGFPIRVPILRAGSAIGALTAVLRPAAVSSVIRASAVPDGWNAWVVDAGGTLVGADDAVAPIGVEQDAYARRLKMGEALENAILPTGEVLRIASMPVGATGWSVTVGMPLAELEALSRKTTAILAATSLATILFCLLAAFIFGRERSQRRHQEMAEAASQRNDALGKLTGQVAHDFNNLLMVFQAGAIVLAKVPQDQEKVKKIIGSMSDAVSRGKEMTERLLSLSRRSNQSAELIDLLGTLRDLQPLLCQAANDSIVIESAIDSNLWPVKVELKSLEIALINLVTNAREAMPTGGRITIRARNIAHIETEQRRLRGPYVALTVMDTGEGIATDNLARIFEPLYSTKPGGAPGLGLTQVSNFAKRSGGYVVASTLLSGGASLTIYLPGAVEYAPKIAMTDSEAKALPQKVLLVDDTPASLEAARLSLESEGIEIVTAKDGYTALELLRRRLDIDGMLSDVMMPDISGIELAEAARRIRPGLRIVLMTGFSDRIERGQKIEFSVIKKPFSTADIAIAFAQALPAINLTETG